MTNSAEADALLAPQLPLTKTLVLRTLTTFNLYDIMAQAVLSDVPPDTGLQRGSLFQGIKFWLSQKVPQRSRFINDVRV